MLTNILQTSLSGLQAAQTGLRLTSQNISNANTPGYVRTIAEQQARLTGGASSGVEISAIRRAAERFLASAAISSTSTSSAADIRATYLDRVQQTFGDPSKEGTLFASIDRAFASFTAYGADPTNSVRASQAVSDLQSTFADLRRAGADLESLRVEADQRIVDLALQINDRLAQIADLNASIRTARASGLESAGAENRRSLAIDELASMIDVRINETSAGGVEIRTRAGALLVGDRAAQLRYSSSGAPYAPASGLQLVDGSGTVRALDGEVSGGTLGGLLAARDIDIPNLAEALGGLAGALADALNAAHNDAAAAPPPAGLDGRATGLAGGDALNFTGRTTIGIVDSGGALLRRIAVDFDAKTLTIDGAAPVSFAAVPTTVAGFVAALNQAMNGAIGPSAIDLGDANFDTGGRLHLSTQGAGAGLVIQQDSTAPSARGGRGFLHFFGLNDVAVRPTPVFFETGLGGGDSGFSGGPIVLRVRDAQGQSVVERSVAAVGASVSAMIAAVNASGTGIGPYAQISAPDANGRVSVKTANGFSLDVVSDGTSRGGLSFSTLFGIGVGTRTSRAQEIDVRSDIVAAPQKLASGRPDLAQGLGVTVIERGDARGLQALAAAKSQPMNFAGAGPLPAQRASLAQIASGLAGEVGRRAAAATRDFEAAEAVSQAAAERRTSVEGVNLDEELIAMTRFQQSYAASTRLIQAAKDMFDILLNLR
jgi:flagellar hook-associated protein 1 FlgK